MLHGHTDTSESVAEVFITTANAARMVRQIPLTRLSRINGVLYKKSIYLFGHSDKMRLLAIKELFKTPKAFIQNYFVKCDCEDTGRYVFPEKPPAYHCVSTCDRLHSDFSNYLIPDFIYTQGTKAIWEYRKWFLANMHLLEDRWDHFQLRFHAQYGIWIRPEQVERANSGITLTENLDLSTLESRIDQLLDDAKALYYSCPSNQFIIKKWGKQAWLGRLVDKPLHGKPANLKDDDIRPFLRDYEQRVINPLKRMLIAYYRISYNPDLLFSGTLLDQLGFHPCVACHK